MLDILSVCLCVQYNLSVNNEKMVLSTRGWVQNFLLHPYKFSQLGQSKQQYSWIFNYKLSKQFGRTTPYNWTTIQLVLYENYWKSYSPSIFFSFSHWPQTSSQKVSVHNVNMMWVNRKSVDHSIFYQNTCIFLLNLGVRHQNEMVDHCQHIVYSILWFLETQKKGTCDCVWAENCVTVTVRWVGVRWATLAVLKPHTHLFFKTDSWFSVFPPRVCAHQNNQMPTTNLQFCLSPTLRPNRRHSIIILELK